MDDIIRTSPSNNLASVTFTFITSALLDFTCNGVGGMKLFLAKISPVQMVHGSLTSNKPGDVLSVWW